MDLNPRSPTRGDHRLAERPNRVLFISSMEAVDFYVYRELSRRVPGLRAVHLGPKADPPAESRVTRIRKHPVRSIRGALRDRVLGPLDAATERAVAKRLFGSSEFPAGELEAAEVVRIPIDRINHPDTVQIVQAMRPDLMIVCGAPILRAPILGVAPQGAFNVHWGIAPDYRGADSIFWAVHDGAFEKIGVTVHRISAVIDGGAIVAQRTVQATPASSEADLWVACARLLPELLTDLVVQAAHGEVVAHRQPDAGRTFRYEERTVGAVVRSALRRWQRARSTPTPTPS